MKQPDTPSVGRQIWTFVAFASAFGAGVLCERLGFFTFMAESWEDVLFFLWQHIKLVLTGSLFAIIIGLVVYGLLPIIRNTVAGIDNINPILIDAARGMGMTPVQTLFKVELPNAMYIILTGIRTSTVILVGTAALSFLVGGGGLGDLIFTGIAMVDPGIMLGGAIPTAILAIAMNWLLGRIEFYRLSPGLRTD